MISIQEEDIVPGEVIDSLKGPETGAIVSFLGVVRKDPSVTEGLEVEVYEEMALEKLSQIEAAVRERFDIQDIAVVHRVGTVAIGENIAFIAVSAAHRSEAFAATRWALEQLKEIVPMWKKEI